MAIVNFYLHYNGNCEEAFDFYKSVFGGEYNSVMRFSEMPAEEGITIPEEEGNKIMHMSLPISKETILMGSDTSEEFVAGFKQGNNFSIYIEAGNKEEADNFFAKLSDGGGVTMPMDTSFWGSYFGMVWDKFGINWMISFDEQES